MKEKEKRPTHLPTQYPITKILKKPYEKPAAVLFQQNLLEKPAQKKYPIIIRECIDPRTDKYDATDKLSKRIINFLRFEGWHAERSTLKGIFYINVKTYKHQIDFQQSIVFKHWMPEVKVNQVSEFLITIDGRKIFIAVITDLDYEDDFQKQYQDLVKYKGGVTLIISSFNQFLSWYIKDMERKIVHV